MKQNQECIGTPGFSGFVPSLRYQYGSTYGNATRRILETDPTLHQGRIQQQQQQPSRAQECHENAASRGNGQLCFPPLAGFDNKINFSLRYTGFVPRSKEHFGQSYVQATNESLADFKIKTNALSKRVEHLAGARSPPNNPSMARTTSAAFCYAASNKPSSEARPASGFINGYTGFVPRLQKHFGHPYGNNVRQAIEEFSKDQFNHQHPQSSVLAPQRPKVEIKTRPVPGSTIFIPGSKYGFATTFGKNSEAAYAAFNQRKR